MKPTLNQIKAELAYLAACHTQINAFFWGDFIRAFKEKVLNYPLMCAYITPTIVFNGAVNTVPIHIVLCDKIYKDWNENLDEVESDMLDLANQVYHIVKGADRWKRLGAVESCTVPQKFISQGGDEVCGYEMVLTLKLKYAVCFENLPLVGYDFGGDVEPPVTCAPGVLRNSSGSFSIQVPSGGVTTAPDITVRLADSELTVPSNQDIELTDYSLVPRLAPGTYIPQNVVSGPFDLLWERVSPDMQTGSGFIRQVSGASDFGSSGLFKLMHTGDFRLVWKMLNSGGAAFPMFGVSYYKSRNYYANLDFAVYNDGGTVIVYENGLYVTGVPSGPVMEYSLERVGNTMVYKANGTPFRVAEITNTGPVNIDSSFASISEVTDIRVIID